MVDRKIKKVLLKTFGCQMNVYDSQVAAGILEKAGFEVFLDNDDASVWKKGALRLSSAASSAGREVSDEPLRPDIVIMNTCSVRDHAEERVWGRLGMLGVEKKERPGLVIGLMGCMVEEHRERLFKRFPQLDLLVGTRNIKELPEMIRQVFEVRKQVALAPVPQGLRENAVCEDYRVRAQRQPATRIARIKQDGISIEYSEFTKRDIGSHSWLPIMTGCDKCCTFCIVPLTRGREVSMPAEEVCREARRLVENGVNQITLLGQNVNSYLGTRDSRLGKRSFPDLLEMLCKIDGLEEISFTTSHPQDATEELFQAIAKNPKISRRFHLPLQSGSDRILKRIKRLHTIEEYKAKVERLRALVPEISITTDIITGFSGETEEDHEATKRALEELRFDGAFIFKYSVRPGTPAAKLPDDVPPETKSRRHQELLTLQRRIMDKKKTKRF